VDSTNPNPAGSFNQPQIIAPGSGGPAGSEKSTRVATAGGLQPEIPPPAMEPMDSTPADASITSRHARVAYNPQKAMVEYIEGLPVAVQPPVGCPVCLTEPPSGLDNLTTQAYAPDNENCIANWHAFCRDCISSVLSYRSAACPLCRSLFTSFEPLQGWGKGEQLNVKRPVYFQPELLSCPGCNDGMLRADIRDHLVNCEENRATVNQNEAEYRESYLNYLKQHDGSVGALLSRDARNRPIVTLYQSDGQGKFEKQAASDFLQNHPAVSRPLHDTSIGSEHQVFVASPGAQMPVVGVIQFEAVNNVAGEGADSAMPSLQLRELPSVTSSFRLANQNDMAELRSMPDGYQALLTRNLTLAGAGSGLLGTSFTHALTALQHTNAPVALSFQANKVAMEGMNLFATNYQKVKGTYLMYGIKIPGAAAYWGIQKVEPDKRIVLEASKQYQLIGLDSMTREEEAGIQQATGQSVRENRSNSVKYTLILSTLMEVTKSQPMSYPSRQIPRGGLVDVNYWSSQPMPYSPRQISRGGVVDVTYRSMGFGVQADYSSSGEVEESDWVDSTEGRRLVRPEVDSAAGSINRIQQLTAADHRGFRLPGSGHPFQDRDEPGEKRAPSSTALRKNNEVGMRPVALTPDSGRHFEGMSSELGDEYAEDTVWSKTARREIDEVSEQPAASTPESSTDLAGLSPELKKALTFSSDVTIKKLSDQFVPTAYRNERNVEAIKRLCPHSLVPQMVTFLDVDILRTPCPVSSKEPPVGLLLEAAVQQMHILNDPG